ncbi:hypothetical protein PPL_11225 [Heterostelium album PN500]|uniref:EGF-like domain-containing protein n=1 Tax=Heterostelium pallidum (strain ATCC 26659 / Pp 5 / PN500) TaxID=670386 RepID=D3BTW5_HETP5|nr:hypothetical protein PPL_11225 [Heterostelium album PN500]EFA75151.1 hypothetical protein PPL_11225 [Heterostelium album PN500]|eukprot:XP_020427285.1 hypothetical protein PPL_11225 [Heterostelium album PN500]
MKVIFYLFICIFIFNTFCSLTVSSQPLTLIQKQPFPPLFPDTVIKKCESGFSVVMAANYWISPTDFSVSSDDLDVSTGVYPNLYYRNTTYGNQDFIPITEVRCDRIYSEITSLDPFTVGFYVDFGITSYYSPTDPFIYNILCNIPPPYYCDMTLTRSNHLYYVQVYLFPKYSLGLNSTITVGFNLVSQSNNITFSSLFPWDYPTVVLNATYTQFPLNVDTYYEDFTKQADTINPIAMAYVRNINKTRLFYTYEEEKYYQFQRVMRSGDDDVYFATIPNQYLQVSILGSFICDSRTSSGPNVQLDKQLKSFSGVLSISQALNKTLNVTFVGNEVYSKEIWPIHLNTIMGGDTGITTIIKYPSKFNETGFYYKYQDILSTEFVGGYYSSAETQSLNVFILGNRQSSNMIRATSYFFIFRITVESNYAIKYIYVGNQILYTSDLIKGTATNGTYEKLIPMKKPSGFIVTIFNVRADSIDIYSGQIYNTNLTLPYYQPFQYSQWDVKAFNSNVLYFNLSNSYPDLTPTLTINKYQFNGFYHPLLKLYTIPFNYTFPVMSGNIDYTISDLYTGSIIPSQLIPFNRSLTILNSDDIFPPQLLDVKAFPNKNVIINSSTPVEIGWLLNIYDQNDFEVGYVDIVSDIDANPLRISFGPSNLVNGKYKIIVPESFLLAPKNISMKNMVLGDPTKRERLYNPLVSAVSTSQSEFRISVDHIMTLVSNVPEISNFIATKEVEIYSPNRTVEFDLYIDYKIYTYRSMDQPLIILTSENGQILNITTSLLKSPISTPSKGHYYASTQLPYGFGMNTIFISVYGIIDSQSNYNAYLSTDLRDNSFPFYIVRKTNMDYPIIESTSLLSSYGGSLTLFGKQFGTSNDVVKCSINYNDGNGFQHIDIDFFSGVVIQISNRVKQTNSTSVDIIITKNKVDSNPFRIILFKTNLDPIPPFICPGTPPCNSQGVCRNSGCECRVPWYGPSCSSKIIIIPTPTPQPDPTTNITITDPTYTDFNNITSKVHVIEVREIDSLMNIVSTYKLANWKLNDQTSQTDHPRYQYQSILDGTNTTVYITIEFFNDSRSIDFGGQQIIISPSTIKYSINISSFDFKLKTNMLQVVMEATIQGLSGRDSCSSKQIGSYNEKNDISWIKMNIDKTSLYGRFISYGILDSRVSTVDNRVLDEEVIGTNETDSSSFRSIKIGITIPYFERSALLDPDFSNLIDVGDDSSELDQICSPKSNKRLSNGIIVAIVVASIVFIAIVTTLVILRLKQRKNAREKQIMQNKLKVLEKDK